MISIFPNISNTKHGKVATPDAIIHSIRNGGHNAKVKDLVSVIRKTDIKSKRNSIKGQLPCIMWSGTFLERRKSKLTKHSGLICLDFDNVENIDNVKAELCKDEHVYACFVSPSGNGLKVVVKIPDDAKNHQSYFRSLADHFSWIDVDSAAKDVSRVCYASYDPEVYYNPDSKRWNDKKDIERKNKIKPEGNRIPDSKALDAIKKGVDNQIEFISGQRHQHLLKFAGWANRAGIPEYDTINYYCGNYDKDDVEKIVSNIYQNYTHEHGKEPIVSSENKEIMTFWLVSSKKVDGEIKFTPVFSRMKFISWLKDNGFSRYHYTGRNWELVRHEDNIVQKTSKSDLKDFVFGYIEELPFEFDRIYKIQLYELVARGVHSFFSDELLEILPSIDIDSHRDTKNECYLYFLNTVVKITEGGVSMMAYTALNGYVWIDQIIDRQFKMMDEFSNDYQELLAVVCGGEDDDQSTKIFNSRMASIESIVGFLLHSYKDPTSCPAIILNDQYINEDNPEGGTGKGIFLNGISQLKKMCKIDGKNHKMDSSFPFQSVDIDTQIMVYEDVAKGWDFERLFSIITEGISIEKKGKDAFYIPFKQSAKTVITTNYTIKGQGNSHERRRVELEFHGHFREVPPVEYFGHMLFDEWDDYHWEKFDNYMVYCICNFLRNGLIRPPVVNLNERRLRERTHPEFIEFVDVWMDLKSFTSKELHDLLKRQNPDFEKYNQSTITRWIKFYMNNLGIEWEKARINNGVGSFRGFEVTKLSNSYVTRSGKSDDKSGKNGELSGKSDDKSGKENEDTPF